LLIQLSDKYRITSIPMNFVLSERKVVEKGDNAGQEVWKEVGYYPSLEALLRGMFKRRLQASECVGVIEIIDEIKTAVNCLSKAIAIVQEEVKAKDEGKGESH
jgi:hypothetical protein